MAAKTLGQIREAARGPGGVRAIRTGPDTTPSRAELIAAAEEASSIRRRSPQEWEERAAAPFIVLEDAFTVEAARDRHRDESAKMRGLADEHARRASLLADTAQMLRDENTALLAENARLRRQLEKGKR